MAYSDGVTHRRWMQVSENKRPDLRRLALHCLMKHLFPTYDIQVNSMATERDSHLINEKNVDEVEWKSREECACIPQHLALRIDEVLGQRGLNPCGFQMAVFNEHETSKQTPLREDPIPHPARKVRERHHCGCAVIDFRSLLFSEPHSEHLQQPALHFAIERGMRSHSVYDEDVIRRQSVSVAIDRHSLR